MAKDHMDSATLSAQEKKADAFPPAFTKKKKKKGAAVAVGAKGKKAPPMFMAGKK